jgi:hypothetical protein
MTVVLTRANRKRICHVCDRPIYKGEGYFNIYGGCQFGVNVHTRHMKDVSEEARVE